MSNTIQEIYAQVISTLSPDERLRLVTLILNELVQPDPGIVNVSDTWTEQDQLDLSAFSAQHAAMTWPLGEGIAE